jgi:4a-hydroxytetrahydrobiopterin dehydratase
MPELTQPERTNALEGKRPLTDQECAALVAELPGWVVIDRHNVKRLERVFAFPDFATALAFTNQVGAMADAKDHHPAILTEWGKVTVTWWTHEIGGLHNNDFIFAAKTSSLYGE